MSYLFQHKSLSEHDKMKYVTYCFKTNATWEHFYPLYVCDSKVVILERWD